MILRQLLSIKLSIYDNFRNKNTPSERATKIIKKGTMYMLTPQLKTTRIILINNINNLFLISAYASNDFFNNLRGNQLPAALKESHVSVNKYINTYLNCWRRKCRFPAFLGLNIIRHDCPLKNKEFKRWIWLNGELN